jgi:hypothetical protein
MSKAQLKELLNQFIDNLPESEIENVIPFLKKRFEKESEAELIHRIFEEDKVLLDKLSK